MDIESYVESEGRDDLVKQVRSKIDELGVDYIYYQFVSLTGRIMGKGVPADHWETMADRGFQLVYGSVANLFMDRRGNYIGYGPDSWELVGIPDPETFVQLPWDKRVARVFCTLFRGREHPEDAGAFLTADCRGNLRRIHEQFQEDHAGLHLRAGTEPEMMWLKKGDDGKPAGGFSNPYCYHIDQFEALRPVYLKTIDYSRAMGLDMIQGDHEDAPGQLELNCTFDDVLRNSDRLTTYRQICAQVAREFGLIACFMPKPFLNVSGSGCHTNISLWRGGEEDINRLGNDPLPGMDSVFTYARKGDNTFMPDTENVRMPGAIGLQVMGGIMEHAHALTTLGCPTVNSYRRLLDVGYWAPTYPSWGHQNRTCAVRVSAPGRFEVKMPDASSNPYLVAAGLLKAADDGIRRNLDPGDPEQQNLYDVVDQYISRGVRKLPMSLGEAIEALENDEVIKTALPGEMYSVFMHYKRDEWERFLSTVTEWDIETYLDVLP